MIEYLPKEIITFLLKDIITFLLKDIIIIPTISSIIAAIFTTYFNKFIPLFYKQERFEKFISNELEFYSKHKLFEIINLPSKINGLPNELLKVNNDLEEKLKDNYFPQIITPITIEVSKYILKPNNILSTFKLKYKFITNKNTIVQEILLTWLYNTLKSRSVERIYKQERSTLGDFYLEWLNTLAKTTEHIQFNNITNILYNEEKDFYREFNNRTYKFQRLMQRNDIVLPKDLQQTVDIINNIIKDIRKKKTTEWEYPILMSSTYTKHINK